MNLDPVAISRSGSPASSEGFAGASPRVRGRDEELLKKDKAFRRYAAGVDRALSLFDSALQEWADYISFLSRLLKTLQSHPPNLAVVPNKVLVAKRLAQCLNPTLPSGVHQKTLEVYSYIFGMLKKESLSHDLPLYLPGIASTLSFASLNVKPLFLSLMETYIVQLDRQYLRPALKSIILSILPGLEEETSEDFERTLRILNKFRAKFSKTDEEDQAENTPYFWQCLFLASITNPSRRLGVLAYLNRHLPRLGEKDISPAVESVVSPEPGLLLRCFATGLVDGQLLVQRNFLDLLVTHLPLDSHVLQKSVTLEDLDQLVSAAAIVVTRRDMGLNRRLWSWFLGPETTGTAKDESLPTSPSVIVDGNHDAFSMKSHSSSSQYFATFGLEPLTRSIKGMIDIQAEAPAERAKPFRIALSLMDRWEVGGPVVPAVFLPILRSVQQYQELATSKDNFEEVYRSANSFFNGVESGLIWGELLHLVHLDAEELRSQPKNVQENLELASFVIDNFNVHEEEMLMVHVPLALLSLLVMVRELVEGVSGELSTVDIAEIVEKVLDILDQLLDLLPERALSSGAETLQPESLPKRGILSRINAFYEQSSESPEPPSPPYMPQELAGLLVAEAAKLVLPTLAIGATDSDVQERMSLFVTLFRKVPHTAALDDGHLRETMYTRLGNTIKPGTVPFATLSAVVAGATALYSKQPAGRYLSYSDLCDLIPLVVRQLWPYLSSSCPKYHVEAYRCLSHIQNLTWHDRVVEAAISSLMVSSSNSSSLPCIEPGAAEKFMVIWSHCEQSGSHPPTEHLVRRASEKIVPHDKRSKILAMLERPLFLTLDALSDQGTATYPIVKLWLQDLPSLGRILALLLSHLHDLCDKNGGFSVSELPKARYFFDSIRNILSALAGVDWSRMATAGVDTAELISRQRRKTSEAPVSSMHAALLHTCLGILERLEMQDREQEHHISQLRLAVLAIVGQLLSGRHAEQLLSFDLEEFLIARLSLSLDDDDEALQIALIDTLHMALNLRYRAVFASIPSTKHGRSGSRETLGGIVRVSTGGDRLEKEFQGPTYVPPTELVKCLLKGLTAPSARNLIEKWVYLLCESLPLHSDTLFQLLLPIVECLCSQIKSSFQDLQQTFREKSFTTHQNAERVSIALLNGLENTLAEAHGKLLVQEATFSPSKSPEQPQGLFGNMISGVFTTEGPPTRGSTANTRLTVLLCFKDAVEICFSIWSWGNRTKGAPQDETSLASFQYTSLRMRNRARRILENLFAAEELECLETLVRTWIDSQMPNSAFDPRTVIGLLHTLEGSRPKIAVPATFNAIYSRTNPSVLDSAHKSSLTSSLSDTDLASFLVSYARSLDDDVLDEIWSDCTSFLRDVLGNPLPHRQILVKLLEFTSIIGEKMENTNFGEERRMKKELGELLLRLLTAIFTIKPAQTSHDPGTPLDQTSDETIAVIASTFPALTSVLSDSDRAIGAIASISSNIIAPAIRSKSFPANFTKDMLALLQQILKVAGAAKSWRRDLNDAFNDPRFFGASRDLVKRHWLPLLRQWVLTDKDRLPDLLTRLTPPTTAGLMFGVGASAARLEADRRTQLTLRRLAVLFLAADIDNFATSLPALQEKLCDLMTATNVTSPSSATRAEIFMVLRAVILSNSPIHLAGVWPIINSELQDAVASICFDRSSETYNLYSLLQACKLLDILLLIAPDEFQLHEWLFVTDTADAVYRPDNWEPLALVDEVSRSLDQRKGSHVDPGISDGSKGLKRPFLSHDRIGSPAKADIMNKVIRPFLDGLSIHAFESTYSLGAPDLEACRDDLLADLLEEATMAAA